MATGRIKAIKADRGFAFAERDGESDVFIHVRDCSMDMQRRFDESLIGDTVTFDVEQTDKGLRAVDVRAAW